MYFSELLIFYVYNHQLKILQLSINSRQLMNQFLRFFINPGGLQKLKTAYFSLKLAVFHVFFTIIDILNTFTTINSNFTTFYR